MIYSESKRKQPTTSPRTTTFSILKVYGNLMRNVIGIAYEGKNSLRMVKFDKIMLNYKFLELGYKPS